MSKRWLRFTLSISLLFLLALCLLILQSPDRMLYDALAAIPEESGQAAIPDRAGMEIPITIVAIDDQSFRELGRRWPWPRQWLAEAVDELARLGTLGIGLDIILSDPGFTEAEDLALARSLEAFTDTVLVSKFTDTPQGPVLEEAQPLFMEYADSGYGNLIYDRDGILRRYAYLEQTRQGFLFPSFAYALFDIYNRKTEPPGTPPKVDPFLDFETPQSSRPLYQDQVPGQRVLDLSILGRNGLPQVSFSSLLAGQVPEGAIRNRIVLIGATYPESKDQVPVPGAKDTPLYGVEVHAHALAGLIQQSFRREASLAARLLVLLVAVLFHGFLVAFLPFSMALTAAGLSMVLGIAATMFLWFRSGFFLPPAVWLGCGLLSIPLTTGFHALLENREKRRLRHFFGRYMPGQLVDHLMAADGLPLLGGENRIVTVLFSDIVAFTSLSESLAPEILVPMLNRYFERMAAAIFEHGGMINKFIGDGIMALFGAPLPLPDAVDHALKAAMAMHASLEGFNADQAARGEPELRMGVGIHTGPAVLGNVGCPTQMDYTCIGDTVNVAARLEALTRTLDTRIVISEAVYKAMTIPLALGAQKTVTVKGRTEPVTVYPVLEAAAPEQTLEVTA